MRLLPVCIFFVLTSQLCIFINSFSQTVTVDISRNLEDAGKVLIGKKFPLFEERAGDKSLVALKAIKNKIVFVNFWFASCSPCMAEMKGLNKLYDTLKNNKDFLYLSFTYDPEAITKTIIEKYDIKYKVINVSKEECKRLNGGKKFPTSFILDRKGVIKWAVVGGPTDEEVATDELISVIYPKILSEL